MFTMLGRSLALVLLVATLVPAAPVDRASHSATVAGLRISIPVLATGAVEKRAACIPVCT